MKKINRYFNNSKKSSGFTILELVIVIVIIGILAAVTITSYIGTTASAKDTSVQSDIDTMDGLQTNYAANTMKGAVGGMAYYSASGYDSTLGFRPSGGDVIDVVVNSTDYCIRGYNPSGTKNNIFNAFLKESTTGACSGLGPSTTAAATYNGPVLGVLVALATPTIVTGTGPGGTAISNDGSSVYSANYNSNNISMYSRNTGTGALTALGTPTIAAGTSPNAIAISADGTSAYAANSGASTISMYSRNTGTGALTALGTPTIATGTNPSGIAISADGKSVYTTNNNSNNISMYSRNTGTGALTALGTPTIATGTNPDSIVVSADGKSVYVSNGYPNTISMYSRNTGTGALSTPSITTISSSNPAGIVISTDGKSVYAANMNSNTISMYNRY